MTLRMTSFKAIAFSTTTMGISLWIVPCKQDAERLERVMQLKLKGASLSDTSYPRFHPHITLASLPTSRASDLESILASIPLRDSPLRCGFADVVIGDAYFRSVYIAIQTTMNLLDVHKRIHDSLHLDPTTPHFPHLSLCYIDDVDAEKGERAVYYDLLRMGGKLKIVEPEGDKEISLNCGFDGRDDWVGFFDASEIWVVKCEGPVEEWKILSKLPLIVNKGS